MKKFYSHKNHPHERVSIGENTPQTMNCSYGYTQQVRFFATLAAIILYRIITQDLVFFSFIQMHHLNMICSTFLTNWRKTITTYTNDSWEIMAVNTTAVLIGQSKLKKKTLQVGCRKWIQIEMDFLNLISFKVAESSSTLFK